MEELVVLTTVVDLIATVVCFRKGRTALGWVGIAGLLPVLSPILFIFPLYGALEPSLVGPDRADRNHSPALAAVPRTDRAAAPASPQPRIAPPPQTRRSSGTGGPSNRSRFFAANRPVITGFLARARETDTIDTATHDRLIALLDSEVTTARAPVEARSVAARPSPTPIAPVPTRSLPDRSPVAPVERKPPPPARPPIPSSTPREPAAPSRLRVFSDAVASEIAIHGFAYLGVLLTIVGILGFLLFAFVDVADHVQPFVELFIAVVFFGWAWALHRQEAVFVAKAMELTGGLVVPLALFAGLVDNAPFPPDFSGRPLVAALAATSLAVSGAYVLISARRPASMLRYLAGPLVWTAVLALGFVFKTDEPLRSDAITRFVSPQGGLAALAIAGTLFLVVMRPAHRLSRPTAIASLVGLPVAYVLTLGLAAAEGWLHTAPLVMLGVGTFASTELLGIRFDERRGVAAFRPILLAGVVAPLVPGLGMGWGGLVVAAAYLVLLEMTLRANGGGLPDWLLPAGGVAVGAGMSFAAPFAAICCLGSITLWSLHAQHRYTRRTPIGITATATAMLAPAGIGWAIEQIVGGGRAWLTMSSLVLAATVWNRLRHVDDDLFAVWAPAAATAVSIGAWATAVASSHEDPYTVAAVGLAASTVGAGFRWPVFRLWTTAATGILAVALGFAAAGVDSGIRSASWAVIGFGLVAVASLHRRFPAGHLAAIGHAVGIAGLTTPGHPEAHATATALWAGAWVATVTASEIGGATFTALLRRTLQRLRLPMRPGEWVAPAVMAVAVFPAALAVTNLVDRVAANRPWNGVTIAGVALAYAAATRLTRPTSPLGYVLSWSAMAASLAALIVAIPAPWPMIATSLGIVAVAAVPSPAVRWPGFRWIGWIATFVPVVLVAQEAGLATESLHLTVLLWGAAIWLGGLALDDAGAGRRAIGEGIRTAWLRPAIVIGALAVPVGLGPVFTRSATVYGLWTAMTAGIYFASAALLRTGLVTLAGYGLGGVALVALAPWDFKVEPWALAIPAAASVAVAWAFDSFQSERSRGDAWLRWDLPPLITAHAFAAFALPLAVPADRLTSTALAFGLVCLVVTVWKRHRAWGEAANALVVAAAVNAGPAWATAAFLATAARGAMFARMSWDGARISHHIIGAASAGAAWISLLVWLDATPAEIVGWSAIVWGMYSVALIGLARLFRYADDTVSIWGTLSVAAFTAVSALALAEGSTVVSGPWLALGYLLFAVALELAGPVTGAAVRLVAVPVTGIAWIALTVGLDWTTAQSIDRTAVSYASFAAVVALAARLLPGPLTALRDDLDHTRAWFALGVGGIAAATVAELSIGETRWSVFAGVSVVAVGFALAARPLRAGWLRTASILTGLAAVTLLFGTAGWGERALVVTLVVLGSGATLLQLGIWTRRAASDWVEPLTVAGVAATVEAALFAAHAWPARELLIVVLLAAGVQAIAAGLVRANDHVLALGPPLVGAGFLTVIANSAAGSAQWYTVPLGLVVLAEVEVYRRLLQRRGEPRSSVQVVVVEAAGLGLIVAPSLVEMFATGLIFGTVAQICSVACFLWAILTRVRRRAVGSIVIALTSAVLMIFAAASSAAPGSAVPWILAVGIGFNVMLVAAVVEAYRSNRGTLMQSLTEIMEDWE